MDVATDILDQTKIGVNSALGTTHTPTDVL